jgi:hypothetical protein
MRTWWDSLRDVMDVPFAFGGPRVGASRNSEHNNPKAFGEQAEKQAVVSTWRDARTFILTRAIVTDMLQADKVYQLSSI